VILTSAHIRTAAFLVLATGLSATDATAQAAPYHILLTNDDGIQSAGIQVLAQHLGTLGEVHLVAPCGQRSGASMSVALGAELHLRPVERDGEMLGHCVDTTPAGAALLAITALAPEGGFDLVVSGINRGANVGTASHMSGTVGGAMMGAYYGIPAIAASLGAGADFEYSAGFVAQFVAEMRRHPVVTGVVMSINIPRPTQDGIEGVTVAPMGGSHLLFDYEETVAGPDGRTFRPRIGAGTTFPEGSDSEAYGRDMITITPILFDWTARASMGLLADWSLTHVVGG